MIKRNVDFKPVILDLPSDLDVLFRSLWAVIADLVAGSSTEARVDVITLEISLEKNDADLLDVDRDDRIREESWILRSGVEGQETLAEGIELGLGRKDVDLENGFLGEVLAKDVNSGLEEGDGVVRVSLGQTLDVDGVAIDIHDHVFDGRLNGDKLNGVVIIEEVLINGVRRGEVDGVLGIKGSVGSL